MPTIALVIWPFIMLIFFAKMPLKKAVLVGVISGHLFLPEAFKIDLPGLPPIEKSSVILIGLLLGMAIFRDKNKQINTASHTGFEVGDRLLGRLMLGAIGLLTVNIFLVVLTNQEALSYGPVTLPGLPPRDIISMFTNIVIIATPFILARKLFWQSQDHRLFLQYLVVAALAYSALILFEIRFSPQLHRWVYGYHQHSFLQHIRDGFRPKVFMDHGLTVGFFLFSACIAAGALVRTAPPKEKFKQILIFGFLCCVLAISRNFGALGLALLFIPFLWTGRMLQLWFVSTITAIFLLYPAVRQAQLLPVDRIHAFAEQLSPVRARSLQYRFDNEDILLAKALQKPVSGWGGWNRARVYNKSGQDISTTDGLWIIQLGQQGWLGYIGFFSLLSIPGLLLFRVRRRKEIPIETVAIALIMTGNLVYLIPNSTLTPIGWLFAGALAGFAQFDSKRDAASVSDEVEDGMVHDRRRTYTRFPKGETNLGPS